MSADADAHLVLVGLMGAGKTAIGRVCARRLGRPFVDTDDLVVAAAGCSIPELFTSEGEDGFRVRERVAVAEACAAPVPHVIACGGGAVLDPASRRHLRTSGVVVWLRAAPDVLAARVGTGRGRPVLDADPEATLTRLASVRAPSYEAVAHHVVETGGRTLGEVADAVLRAAGVAAP